MIEYIFTWISVALGIVVGTFITWLISYYIMKRYAGRFWKVISENPEIKKMVDEFKSGKMFESVLEKPEVKELLKAVKEWVEKEKVRK